MYSILPKHNSTFTTDTTIEEETFSTIKNPKSITSQELTSARDVQTNSQPTTHCSQIIPLITSTLQKLFTVFLLTILQISLVYTQQIHFLLKHTPFLFQTLYAVLSEYIFLFKCLELSSTNSMSTLIQVIKELTILSPILLYPLSLDSHT